ncbi:MAG: CsgG/HfaB family protein [Deltaproteobacteria bacterium]
MTLTRLKTIIAITITMLVLCSGTTNCFAIETAHGQKDTILVGRLDVQAPVIAMAKQQGYALELELLANSLSTQLISSLGETSVFQLVERTRKEDIELEQGFASVAVDLNDKNIAQAGKMAGAKFIFLPQIDGFEDNSEVIDHKAIERSSLNRKVFLSATVSIVDSTTGKLFADSISVQLTKEEIIDSGRKGQMSGNKQAMIIALSREMAKQLSQEVVATIYPAKVLSITGKQIMFNRGTEAGFNHGDAVEIYVSREVKDPDTGEMFRNEIPVGKAIVLRAEKKQGYATISEDLGIANGCIVRRIKKEIVGREKDYSTPGSSEQPLKWK